MRQRQRLNTRSGQRGVVLFVALILLLILSLLGVTAARMQTTEERMARNEDNRQIGSQAAEAALRAAEAGLANGLYGPTQFANGTPGFYPLNPANGSVVPGLAWNTAGVAITYPDPANPMPPLTSLPTAAQSPKYVIENLPAIALPGDSIAQQQYSDAVPGVTVYRVTANASGADSSSTTILQSIFR